MIETKCIICETIKVRVCMIITFLRFERVKPENDEKVADLFRYGSEFLFTQFCYDRSRAASKFSIARPLLNIHPMAYDAITPSSSFFISSFVFSSFWIPSVDSLSPPLSHCSLSPLYISPFSLSLYSPFLSLSLLSLFPHFSLFPLYSPIPLSSLSIRFSPSLIAFISGYFLSILSFFFLLAWRLDWSF